MTMMTTRKLFLLLMVTSFLMVIILTSQVQGQTTKTYISKFEENDKNAVKPHNRSCYTCVGDRVPNPHGHVHCSTFRRLWRKYKKASKDYKGELHQLLRKTFGTKCIYGTEDCYYTRPKDTRITGFESRGCGSSNAAAATIDAEPGEGCAFDTFKKGEEEIMFMSCVCDNADFCNGANSMLKWSTYHHVGLVGVTLLLVLGQLR